MSADSRVKSATADTFQLASIFGVLSIGGYLNDNTNLYMLGSTTEVIILLVSAHNGGQYCLRLHEKHP